MLRQLITDARFHAALFIYNHRPFKRFGHTTWVRFLWWNGVRPF